MPQKKKLDLEIAILGGGFAGVYCGQSLQKTLGGSSKSSIGLIADENYMVFQPMLPEVVSGSLSPRHVVNPIRHLCKGITVYKARVEKIDLKNKQLTLKPGEFSEEVILRFKHLVLALGAKVDLSRVPGMSEHAFLMQNVGDAMKLRASLLARFEEANLAAESAKRRRLLTFVVVGGGYSGVETAGQILDLCQDVNRYYTNIDKEDFAVHLIHSRDHLLPTLSESLGKYTARKLTERGLKLSLEQRVKSVTANQVTLSDGTIIESNTIISTVGNAPHPLITKLAADANLETIHGRIKTEATMQVPGYDWLWAAGDCAAVPMENGEACPSTAQFAMRQGALLGSNLNAFIRAEPTKPFTFKGLGELAAIGHRSAVAEVMGLRFSGFIAWWMWRTIYLSKLPGLDRKLRVLIDWTLDLFFPRDINLLNPRYTNPLQQAYLEPGDVLFKAGEPAFSFYVVQSGQIELSDESGKVVKVITQGEFFGERALLTDRRWQFTAIASEKTSLIGMGSSEFKALLQSSRAMRKLLEHSAKQYRTEKEIETMQSTLPMEVLEKPAAALMTRDVVQLRKDASIIETMRRFNAERHSFYPLTDPETGSLSGVLARDDFYAFIQEEGLDKSATIETIPVISMPTIASDADIASALEVMIRTGSNKLLVLKPDQSLAGILSIRDIMADIIEGC